MISPRQPEPSNPSVSGAVLTESEQRFEMLVEDAVLSHLESRSELRSLEPLTLLAYTAGRLDSQSKERFQTELERKGGIASVVATVKAGRRPNGEAGFPTVLASQIVRGFQTLTSRLENPKAEDVLKGFLRFVHQANVIRPMHGSAGIALDSDLRQAAMNDDCAVLSRAADSASGERRALLLGASGRLEEAREAWSRRESEVTKEGQALARSFSLLNDNSQSQQSQYSSQISSQDASHDPLNSLQRRLQHCRRDAGLLLRELLAAAQQFAQA